MSNYSSNILQALNNLSPILKAAGYNLGDDLDAIRTLILSGNLGITADAGDVDALAYGGGHFTRDRDAGNGTSLVFAWKASRFYNGKQLVTVAAGNLTLSASANNYVQVDQAGTVTANTTGFATDGSKLPLWRVVTGAASYSDANVFIQKPLLTWVPRGLYTGDLLSLAGRTKETYVNLGDLSATATFRIALPANAGTIQRVSLVSGAAQTADDTNNWTFDITNKGAANAGTTKIVDGTAAANTTKATGGSAIAANVVRALTLNGVPGTDAALDFASQDVLVFTATKAGTATTLTGASLRIDSTFSA